MRNHRILLLAALLMFLTTSVFAQTTFFTTLSGANEPDGGDPDGVGHSVVTVSGNKVSFIVTGMNLSPINGTHIHRISSGGNVVVDFAPAGQAAPTYTNGVATGTVTVTTAAQQAIVDEIIARPSNFYVNVHSTEKPDGAIRGSLTPISAGGTGISGQEAASTCVQSDTAMCLDGSRMKVEASWSTPTGNQSGVGHAVRLTADSGYFWFFNAANIEVNVKAINACGAFSSHWVFASGLTNVQVTLKVTDTFTGKTRTYTNPNGTAFLPIQDTSAFGCGLT